MGDIEVFLEQIKLTQSRNFRLLQILSHKKQADITIHYFSTVNLSNIHPHT
jgi:hypothetical protein